MTRGCFFTVLTRLDLGSDQQVDLRFRDVCFSVAVSKAKAALTGGEAGVKEILKGVSGVVESGQILAIIGSSGAGKTSLLDILVGKVQFGRTSSVCFVCVLHPLCLRLVV